VVSPAREYSLEQHLLERLKFTARYLMDTLLLNKLMNPLLHTPRLASVLVVPHGFPKATQFELNVTLGE